MAEKNAAFLQSWEWGNLQEGLGRKILRLSGSGFASLLIQKPMPFGLNYFYAPRGPIIEKIDDLKKFIDLAKNHSEKKTVFLRLEPIFSSSDIARPHLRSLGLYKAHDIQPETTQIINLEKNERDLFREADHATRYAIKAAERRGVKIVVCRSEQDRIKNFNDFWKLLNETGKRHRLKNYPKEYYEKVVTLDSDCRSELFLAKLEETTISAALIVFFGKTATYLYSASLGGYGRYNAPTFLLWKAILTAKREGCSIFDFWGVSDKNKRWAGLTAFKRSFGGKEINYSGTWDYPLNKKWYAVYRLAHALGDLSIR